MPGDSSDSSRITTDRETIRQWAEMHDLMPVRVTERGRTVESSSPYGLYTETEQIESTEPISWDEFFQQMDEEDLVVIFHGEEVDSEFEVVEQDEAVSRIPGTANEVEESLLEGETVTSDLSERSVVERTNVDQATIESQIVETELLDSRVVDAQLVSRDFGEFTVVDQAYLDEVDHARFEDVDRLNDGYQEVLPQPVTVEVDVEETWKLTRELLERATIESRIVDVDASGADEGGSEAVSIVEIQQALTGSDLIETEADADEAIETGAIESEFQEDDVIRTWVNQRRIVEDEFFERRQLRGELTESEVRQIESMGSTPIETSFFAGDSLDAAGGPSGGTEAQSVAGSTHDEGAQVALSDDDEGKPVVDGAGEAIGMVEEVRGGTAYVDPEPGLVDRIKSILGWGDADDEDYTIDEGDIERITDDEVELSLRK